MAEELVCGESWWNSPLNLLCSSPCFNSSFGYDLIMEMRFSDDGISSSAMLQEQSLSSTATHHHWNQDQDLLQDTRRWEDNYRPQINKDSNFGEDASMKPRLNSISECVTTCPGAGLSAGFPLNSDYVSSLLQTLFDIDSNPQQSLLDKNHQSSNGFLPKSLWNSTAAALNTVQSDFLPSPQSKLIFSSLNTNQKPDIHGIAAKLEEGKNLATVVKKVRHGPAFKRTRIETPSPLPTFKVRKEKLGDRITALQQLVSPFGKTDTASVLHEAIEYIKFLHDQVHALSTPYLKHGSPQRQQGGDKPMDEQVVTKELRIRGLCLVPISITFPVASETTSDFWTPTFGRRTVG